jgi:hypothetical protein
VDDDVPGIDQHPVAGRESLDPDSAEAAVLEAWISRSAIEPTCLFERPDVMIMVSAMDVLPTRSISTVSSAFMSSRQARATEMMSPPLQAPLRQRGEAEEYPPRG